MQAAAAIMAGVAGACTLTVVHETARRLLPGAPQVNAIGERAIRKSFRAAGRGSPDADRLYWGSLAGELVSNSLYYALAGVAGRDRSVGVGSALGVVGGIGAFALPEPLGLGSLPDRRTPATQLMTVAWYTLGGLVAGLAFRQLARERGAD